MKHSVTARIYQSITYLLSRRDWKRRIITLMLFLFLWSLDAVWKQGTTNCVLVAPIIHLLRGPVGTQQPTYKLYLSKSHPDITHRLLPEFCLHKHRGVWRERRMQTVLISFIHVNRYVETSRNEFAWNFQAPKMPGILDFPIVGFSKRESCSDGEEWSYL